VDGRARGTFTWSLDEGIEDQGAFSFFQSFIIRGEAESSLLRVKGALQTSKKLEQNEKFIFTTEKLYKHHLPLLNVTILRRECESALNSLQHMISICQPNE
jgi:hypothetical protein